MAGKREKKLEQKRTYLEQISFTELKKLVDEGYEYFWSKPHRRMLRPERPSFGYMDVQDHGKKTKAIYDEDFIT